MSTDNYCSEEDYNGKRSARSYGGTVLKISPGKVNNDVTRLSSTSSHENYLLFYYPPLRKASSPNPRHPHGP